MLGWLVSNNSLAAKDRLHHSNLTDNCVICHKVELGNMFRGAIKLPKPFGNWLSLRRAFLRLKLCYRKHEDQVQDPQIPDYDSNLDPRGIRQTVVPKKTKPCPVWWR